MKANLRILQCSMTRKADHRGAEAAPAPSKSAQTASAPASTPSPKPRKASSLSPEEAARKSAEQAARQTEREAAQRTEREAVTWARSARFLTTASKLNQLPPGLLPEVAFVGRSNAGKSTAINTLADHKRLAFASKTPGRTQHLNVFEVGPREAADARWVDLPGYGHAAVSRSDKHRWQKVMADYLVEREPLAGIVLLVDSRHGFTPLDQQLLDFVAERVTTGEVRLLVLLTKADKLTRAEAAQSLAQAQAALADLATEEADIGDRKSTRLNSSHNSESRMPSSA
jgi:GTP-binding protein